MRSFKIAILILCVGNLLLTGSCKKYEDGPLLNIYSKKNRIDGRWDLESFTVNGYDSTSALKNKPYFGRYTFSKKEDSGHMIALYSSPSNTLFNKTGYWELRHNKEDLYISLPDVSGVPVHAMGPYGEDNITWEIRRLTSDQLWLKTIFNGSEYYLKLKYFK